MLDPAIKLFGKTIPLSDSQLSLLVSEISDPPVDQPPQHKDVCRETTKEEIDDSPEEEVCKQNTLDCKKSSSKDNKEMLDIKCEEEQVTTNVSGQDKILKKPDKIIPCPRCNSLETKFCYYNNYNVNQPRHFCKNCQRYWTAGGTMRNVPVGAGRRKNKHIASQYRHIMMSNDGVPTAQTDTADPATHKVISCGSLSSSTRPLIGNETVLKFCPETPLCESMTSALNLGDQKKQAEIASGVSEESGEKPSLCDQVAENVGKSESPRSVSGSCNGPSPHSLQCYPGPPWVYPWNSGWNGVDPMVASRCSSEMICRPETGNPKQVAWGAAPLPMVAAPAFCTPTIPFPFVPAAYWGCMQGWTAGTWNVPWVGSTGNLSPSSSTNNSGCSSSGSPTLGKHCRDTNLQGEDKSEKCLWVPKTLRIDDPDEAAKSSIWATLGIKPNQKEPLQKGGIFKAFQSKTGGTGPESDATHIMHSNPAALSRSQAFQEST